MSVREAFDTKLLALSRVLTTNTERLKNVYSLLNNAAQNNTQTHDVLERMHALLQDYEVNARIDAKTYIQVTQGAHSHGDIDVCQPLCQNLNGTYISVDTLVEDSQLLLNDAVSLIEDLTKSNTVR